MHVNLKTAGYQLLTDTDSWRKTYRIFAKWQGRAGLGKETGGIYAPISIEFRDLGGFVSCILSIETPGLSMHSHAQSELGAKNQALSALGKALDNAFIRLFYESGLELELEKSDIPLISQDLFVADIIYSIALRIGAVTEKTSIIA